MDAQQPKIKKIGTRDDVFNGLAIKTKSGMTKDDFIKNIKGVIVSKKRSELSKSNYIKNNGIGRKASVDATDEAIQPTAPSTPTNVIESVPKDDTTNKPKPAPKRTKKVLVSTPSV